VVYTAIIRMLRPTKIE